MSCCGKGAKRPWQLVVLLRHVTVRAGGRRWRLKAGPHRLPQVVIERLKEQDRDAIENEPGHRD